MAELSYPEEYMYQEYPKYVYHRDGASTIVQSAAEFQALGPGWYEKLSDMDVETCPAAKIEEARGSEVMPGFVAGPKAKAPESAERKTARG